VSPSREKKGGKQEETGKKGIQKVCNQQEPQVYYPKIFLCLQQTCIEMGVTSSKKKIITREGLEGRKYDHLFKWGNIYMILYS